MKNWLTISALCTTAIIAPLGAQTQPVPPAATAHPTLWPKVPSKAAKSPSIEARIDQLLSAMSIEDKVGQLIQVDLANVKPEDLRTYKLGSVLNGGNSGPSDNDKAPIGDWLKLADDFYEASMSRSDGRPAIPIIWGTDALHGNNNIPGATLFPHNIGLGAARDANLVRRIGQATAHEIVASGQEWTFAPTVAVARDDRWGRTYESYAEDPALVSTLGGAMVEGLQGKAGTPEFLSLGRVIATSKHFLADGGTDGQDQGNARISERELIDIHFPGYRTSIEAGVQTIMVSFSSWNGVKTTGNKSLITDVLKDRVGFDGFLVGDWNAHGQLPGCTVDSCSSAINDGLDMFMYSGNNWRKLYENTVAQARSGEISAARLDDAVRRILRVKLRYHLFDIGKPSDRLDGGKYAQLAPADHRALAREAVRKSMVLLKNQGVLPIKPNANVLVAGKAADDIAQASGGWTISWQGDNLTNADFPNAQSIWRGIEQTVKAGGGHATYATDGAYAIKPDVAIVVFGEKPYAEMMGDRPDLEFSPSDKSDLALLRKLKAQGIPVVAVFLSGRPLWVNAELNASDAFVAAFLPGSEGGGVADVLFRHPDGGIAHDFQGKLSFSWPKSPDQFTLNKGDKGYAPLFPFGYGLSYAKPGTVKQLSEERPAGVALGSAPLLSRGRLPDGWNLALYGPPQMPRAVVQGASGSLFGGIMSVKGVDRRSQEDARTITWSGRTPGEVRIDSVRPIDLTVQADAGDSLIIEYRVDKAPESAVELGLVSGNANRSAVEIGTAVKAAPVGAWQTIAVPLRCFAAAAGADLTRVTSPFLLSSSSAMELTVSDVRIGKTNETMPCNAN